MARPAQRQNNRRTSRSDRQIYETPVSSFERARWCIERSQRFRRTSTMS